MLMLGKDIILNQPEAPDDTLFFQPEADDHDLNSNQNLIESGEKIQTGEIGRPAQPFSSEILKKFEC